LFDKNSAGCFALQREASVEERPFMKPYTFRAAKDALGMLSIVFQAISFVAPALAQLAPE
jgi:hypothetical protein